MNEQPLPDTVSASSAVERPVGTAADIETLFADLDDLTAGETPADADEEIREVKELLAVAHARGRIDSGGRRLRPSDAPRQPSAAPSLSLHCSSRSRLVAILAVSFLVATVLMMLWAASVVGTGRSLPSHGSAWCGPSPPSGRRSGTSLPGERSGDDINDDLAEFGDMVRDIDESGGRSED
jgi:hypothetical protein